MNLVLYYKKIIRLLRIILQGFMAEHMTVCGGHLEADETEKSVFR